MEALQCHDDEIAASGQARNNLESYVFENKDIMSSDNMLTMSSEEERDSIISALNEAGDWMDEYGYSADTKVHF